MAFGATLVAAGMPRAAATDAPDQVGQIARLDVAVWLPTGGQIPYPVVLFSHGVGGCKTQSSYLMRALARDGILVVAPDHEDKDDLCPTRLPGLGNLPCRLLDRANWNPSFYEGRRTDIQALQAALPADPSLSPLIDPGRVALVGHSPGGYTVLGLAGAWPSWNTGGIAAAVALAPFVQPFSRGGTPAGIGVPVLYQRGGRDGLITPAFEAGGFYAATPTPACKASTKALAILPGPTSRPTCMSPQRQPPRHS